MTPAAQLAEGVAALGLTLGDDGEPRLLAYLALLDKWNRVHNLTAVRDPERMVSHHLLDSLAIVPYLQAAPGFANALRLAGEGASVMPKPIKVLDVGSGGGLPGIPLAIARPDLDVTLIDSIAKKTAFLTQAKTELSLDNLHIATGRVEDFCPDAPFEVITSRAFSDLREFVTLTRHLLAPSGRWLAMKGVYPHEEIAALPGGVRLAADHVLQVAGLDAARHLVTLEPV